MTTPGKPSCGFWPKPTALNSSHISRGVKPRAMRAAPTLLDFWITSLTVRLPCGCESLIVKPLIVILPGAVWITVDGVTRFVSRAQPTTKGFIVEPGSKVSVSARLRSCAPLRLRRSEGE